MLAWLEQIRLLSFDAYGTLVQLAPVRQPILDVLVAHAAAGGAAGDNPEAIYREFLQATFATLEELATQPDRFITTRQIFTDVFAAVLPRHGIAGAQAEVVAAMAEAHRQAPFFPEVAASLDRLVTQRPDLQRWLASDIDDDLLAQAALQVPGGWHGVVTSQSSGGYKLQPNGRFWGQLLSAAAVEPAAALHIGDAVSDVAGAARYGLRTCWVNRHGRTWDRPEAAPDLTVRHLGELVELLTAAGPRSQS